ncbi:DUF4169 family protein [Asticcacaulis sp.]|jgi:hypothetical protein|uniref:DUF4169 family protein n=1 Tax=Asticcacaulis sp. TaxID=1872648 RepID=UPI0031D29DB2
MSDVINLNKARKARQRERDKTQAAQNRVTFGLPGHLRRAAREDEARRDRQLDGQKRRDVDKSENG